ncbi:InlB B-repeat-containing protein [Listeria monocytogenes]|uniref:InlB B-repeat-containing protein n=1 Tax=Listeria monocytogenes TaxID=1639 RepID=UPI0010B5053D|nr:LPXTG cell wall anchor domain-containing protein [Listeria monocytogenes]EAF6538116.1 LPXTG cell wall anchor domain-containing protein [Listeria monocytogenes]ECQ9551320.1 LPXTG cell wall anchor domain-containing protein [Listeria monocytogenes]ECW3432907.1 LPXTG cell wall anchor domain-containing protein [Listeria monocytogenes]EIM9320232.1 InlB B-repeat-containing protein [Listeria monocytogenes]
MKSEESNNRLKKLRSYMGIKNVIGFLFLISFMIVIGTSNQLDVQAENLTQPTAIDEIFPDPALADAMRSRLGKASVTDIVSQNELDQQTGINVPEEGIKDLEGIQYLNNLSSLYVYFNEITDISVISKLYNLKHVYLDENQINDISALSNLTNLTELSLGSTQISDISALSNLTNLTALSLSDNQLNNLDALSGLQNLKLLNLKKTQTSDISALSGLTNLDNLYLGYNQISDISTLSGLKNLENLYLEHNQIRDISPLSSLTKLTGLTLFKQEIMNDPIMYNPAITISNDIKDVSGSLIAPATISDNGTYTNPNITWNLSSYLNEVSYTFRQTVTVGNATDDFYGTVRQPLQAIPVDYTATFDVNGTETKESVETGDFLTEPAEPTKEGYTFIGWYDAKTGGNKWDFSTDKMPAEDMTLYAQFSINDYTATFDVDGKKTTELVNYQSMLLAPAEPKKVGYTFTGWYDAKTGGNKWDFATGKMPARDMTLYAQFSINKYVATFDVDGKTTAELVNYQSMLSAPAEPKKEGYKFIGWYDAKTGGNKWDFAADKMPAKDMTLYAQFEKVDEGFSVIVPENTDKPSQGTKQVDSSTSSLPKTGDTSSFWFLAGVLFVGIGTRMMRKARQI